MLFRSINFRVDKQSNLHFVIGKASFTEEALTINVKAMIDALNKAKPSGAKGKYLKKAAISSSMGPGIRIDVAELGAA